MKRMLGVVVACIVGVVLVAGFAAPLLSSIGGNITVTVDNSEATYTMHEAGENEAFTVEWSNGQTLVNGVSVVNGKTPGVVIAENILILASTERLLVNDYVNDVYWLIVDSDAEIVFSNGTYTYTKGTTEYTGTYDFAWVIDPHNGDWSVIELNKTFNVNKDTDFYLFTSSYNDATTNANSPYSIWKYRNESGSMFLEPRSINGTVTDYELNWDDMVVGSNDYNYEYNNNAVLSFTIGDNTSTEEAYALVPTQYETSNTMTETSEKIISILPIMFILILLIIAAYSIMDYVRKSKLEY